MYPLFISYVFVQGIECPDHFGRSRIGLDKLVILCIGASVPDLLLEILCHRAGRTLPLHPPSVSWIPFGPPLDPRFRGPEGGRGGVWV